MSRSYSRYCKDEQRAMRYGGSPAVLDEIETTKECIAMGGGMFIPKELLLALAEAPEVTGEIVAPMVLRFVGKPCEPPRDPFKRGAMEAAWKKAVESAEKFVNGNTPEKIAARSEKARKGANAKHGKPPTREECEEFGKRNGIRQDVVDYFFCMHANAEPPWTDREGKPIKNWRAMLLSAWHAEQSRAGVFC